MSETTKLSSSSTQAYSGAGDCEVGSTKSLVQSSASGIANAAWWTFVAGMLLESISGSLWTFGEYSNAFKIPPGPAYSQTSVQTLGLFAAVGNYVVLDGGFVVAQFGSTVSMIYGCALVVFGYLALWVSITVKAQPPFSVIGLLFVLFGHGCGTIDNAVLTELLNRFPNHPGYVVGCVKGFYGLSAGVLTILANLLFRVDSLQPEDFILFLSVYAAIVGVMFIPVIHICKGVVTETSDRIQGKLMLVSFGLLVGAGAILVLAMNHLEVITQTDKPIHIAILVILVLVIGSLFLVVLPSTQANAVEEDATLLTSPRAANVSYQTMLRSNEFWMLFAILVAAIGTGLMFTNNIGQILPAYEGAQSNYLVPSFVAMMSCLNAVGRVSSGFVSEMMKAHIARPWFLVFFLGLQMVAFLVLVIVGRSIVWPAGALVAYSWGGLWAMVPVLCRELFGPRDFSIKYAMSILAGIGGSLLFSTLLAARLFDREAEARFEAPFCYSPSCFSAAFAAAGFANFLAMMLAIVLCRWTAPVYAAESSRGAVQEDYRLGMNRRPKDN